jgi:hypothetical protein
MPKRPSKRPVSGPSTLESVLVILEEIRSQNRATIEAVEASRTEIKHELQQAREQTNARFEVLEAAVRQNSVDLRHLTARMDSFKRIEERVAALERRRA